MKKKCCHLRDNKEKYCRKNQTHISYLIIEKKCCHLWDNKEKYRRKNQTHISYLTLNLLTSTIVAPPSKASKWQMGFNSAFKGLIIEKKCCPLWDNKEKYCRKNQTYISYLIIEKKNCHLWDNKEKYCRKNQTHISYLIIEKKMLPFMR